MVHRIVADAFIQKIEGKEYINHIDGNRLNNNLENLEWCNHTENNNHAFDNDLIKTAHKIVLVNNETKNPYYFRSMTKASNFLGKRHGYVSSLLKNGVSEIDGYQIFIEVSKIKSLF
jgi:hypothetical protein